MRQNSHRKSRMLVLPAAAAVLAASGLALQVQAEGYGDASAGKTTPAELQRGVPGIDVDLGTQGPAASNGVPGIDVDLRASGSGTSGSETSAAGDTGSATDTTAAGDTDATAGSDSETTAARDSDTSVSGAGPDQGDWNERSGMRAPIQDRN